MDDQTSDQPTEHADPTSQPAFNATPTIPLGGISQPPDAAAREAAAREAAAPPIPPAPGAGPHPVYSQPQTPGYPPYEPYPLGQQPRYRAYPGYPEGYAYPRDRRGYPAGTRERRGVSTWIPLAGGCLIAIAALMALCAAGTGVLGALSLASTPASDTITRNFTVGAAPSLELRSDLGNVHVTTGSAGAIKVVAEREVRAFSSGSARQLLDNIRVETTQDGDTVRVTLTVANANDFRFFTHANRRSDLTITVPAATNVNASLAAGNMDITGTRGALTADLAAGNLRLTDLAPTGTADVSVNAGNLTVRRVSGPISARVDFGNLTLDDVSLANASTLRVSAGNVDLTGELAPSATLDVVDHAGNVTLALPLDTSAHLEATSNAGNITIAQDWPISVARNVANATAAGDLRLNPTGAITVHVDTGNITIQSQ